MYDTIRGLSAGAGAGASYLGDQAVDSRPPAPINLAHNALEEARQLAFRIDAIVDRLCGSQPVPVSKTGDAGITGSVFSGLRDDAERTVEAIRMAMGQLNRLERELP